jgi:hypothetical protein
VANEFITDCRDISTWLDSVQMRATRHPNQALIVPPCDALYRYMMLPEDILVAAVLASVGSVGSVGDSAEPCSDC